MVERIVKIDERNPNPHHAVEYIGIIKDYVPMVDDRWRQLFKFDDNNEALFGLRYVKDEDDPHTTYIEYTDELDREGFYYYGKFTDDWYSPMFSIASECMMMATYGHNRAYNWRDKFFDTNN